MMCEKIHNCIHTHIFIIIFSLNLELCLKWYVSLWLIYFTKCVLKTSTISSLPSSTLYYYNIFYIIFFYCNFRLQLYIIYYHRSTSMLKKMLFFSSNFMSKSIYFRFIYLFLIITHLMCNNIRNSSKHISWYCNKNTFVS